MDPYREGPEWFEELLDAVLTSRWAWIVFLILLALVALALFDMFSPGRSPAMSG